MKANYLKVIIAVAAVLLFTSVSARASDAEYMRQVSGEVTWIDLGVGKLQLEKDVSPRTGEITEYRITEHETRVTNPSDSKFLTVKDLQPGQHVTLDLTNGNEELIIPKITVDPRPVSDFQQAYGEIEAVDAEAGTFALAGRPRADEMGEISPAYFVFDPKSILVMQSPSSQPVQLTLKRGDVVKVDYVVKDGKQWANSITRYSPRVTTGSTTTTTTVTTTQ